MPRVLFSYRECRAVVIDLQSGEELGDHHVRPGKEHSQHLPANAVAEPIPALDTTGDQAA
jgi:hypothetical protein